MKILVVNCGSSSLKYQLIDMTTEEVLAKGYLERIKLLDSFLTHSVNGEKYKIEKSIPNHEEGFKLVIEQLMHSDYGVVKDLNEIDAVGHRVVHGGEHFTESTLITDNVISAIKDVISLAPLHNPAAISGIEACKAIMNDTPMVAVFDTAFHQTLPKKAFMYAIPVEYYTKHKIRKYGFHGTSHKFVANQVAEVMNKDIKDLKILVCHLGQGASLCAIKDGKSIETTMGLTPLAGVPMGSRSGDIDPSVVTYLMNKEGLSCVEMDEILNKNSGKFGLSQVSMDDRDIETAAKNGNEEAKLAIDNFTYNVAGFIGKLTAQMNGVDVIAFTAGIGENGIEARADICAYLEYLGIKIDAERNNSRGKETLISTDDSKVKVYVIPTNEELMIARDTKSVTSK